jgi:hypothetical protein
MGNGRKNRMFCTIPAVIMTSFFPRHECCEVTSWITCRFFVNYATATACSVGGGDVAERKARLLLEAGAD